MKPNNLPSIKMTVLGESSAGKTTMIYRLVKNIFTEHTDSTIGASFMTLTCDDFKFEIWDTAGQDRYLSLMPMYYRGADVMLMVYDLTNIKTIDRVIYYLRKVIDEVSGNWKIIIVGNKLDLVDRPTVNMVETYLNDKLTEFKKIADRIDTVVISTKSGENFDAFSDKLKRLGRNQVDKKFSNLKKDIVTLYDPTIPIPVTSRLQNAYEYCNC